MLADGRNKPRAVYFILLMASLAWLGSIFAAPWLMANGYPIASMVLYQGFSGICHQVPDRSFHFRGFPLGVCARCTGIYTGFFIGLLIYPQLRSLAAGFPTRWWLVAMSIPMLIDFAAVYLGLITSNALSRAVTGLLFGGVTAFYILPGFVSLLESHAVEMRGNRSD